MPAAAPSKAAAARAAYLRDCATRARDAGKYAMARHLYARLIRLDPGFPGLPKLCPTCAAPQIADKT